MSDQSGVNRGRRSLVIASACAGGAATVATAVPFAASMLPSERAEALGAPVEVDISPLNPGEKMTVEWRGQPVWILRRTKEMLEEIKQTDGKVADPQSERKKGELTPEYARNEFRSIKPEIASGREGFIVLATDRSSTSRGGFTRTNPPRTTSGCRPTCTFRITGS